VTVPPVNIVSPSAVFALVPIRKTTPPLAPPSRGCLSGDALLLRAMSRIGEPDDPLYLVDADPIEFGDFRLRHSVVRQGADPTELRGRYHAGAAPDRPPSSRRLWLGWRLVSRGAHRHHRRNSENARLASRFVFGGEDRVRSRYRGLSGPGLWPRLKQVFRVSTRSVDLFAIILSV
jgi:hypothetical protein